MASLISLTDELITAPLNNGTLNVADASNVWLQQLIFQPKKSWLIKRMF